MILDFQMHTIATVESAGPGLWQTTARAEDGLFSAEVSLHVRAPALDITEARLDVKRDDLGFVPDISQAAQDLIGIRVGPGMTKIIRGVVGGDNGSDRVAELVLEAMEMLVNAITVPELRKAFAIGGEPVKFDSDGPKVFLNDVAIGDETIRLMGSNPRLKDSCAAFRDL
jgi:hypothetical protein